MEMGSIKKWQIGLGVPLLTGALIWSIVNVDPTAQGSRTISTEDFEREVRSRPVGKQQRHPKIWNVVVYPPQEGVWTVTFNWLTPHPDRKIDQFVATQWSLTAKTARNNSNETIPQWLDRLQRELAGQEFPFTYRYAWWRDAGWMTRIWGAGSAVLVVWGVLVPGVGFLLKTGRESRRPSAARAHSAAPTAAGLTVTDSDQLDELLGRLSEDTAGVSTDPAPVGTAPNQPGQPGQPTKPATLFKAGTGGSSGEVSAPTTPEPEEKDYRGEFYPVARSGPAGGATGGGADAGEQKPDGHPH